MNRTIKFRVWDGLMGKFVTDNHRVAPDVCYNEVVLDLGGNPIRNGRRLSSENIVSRFTGRRDDRGADVYEGDVITYFKSAYDEEPTGDEETGRVFYCNDNCCFGVYNEETYEWYKLFVVSKINIIGNIFENQKSPNRYE
jgi:hypothetical protein